MGNTDKQNASKEIPPGGQWPYCEVLAAECVVHSLAQRMGTEPLARLLDFVTSAKKGARLSLQRNGTERTFPSR